MELPADLLDMVFSHSATLWPQEACGVLAGPCDGAGPRDWWPMRNVADHPRYRYAFDIDEQLAVWKALDAIGHRVFAIYHSHTVDDDRGEPSMEDRRYALDPDILHLIVGQGVVGEVGSHHVGQRARLWKIVHDQAFEVPYTIVERLDRVER
jgi:proteasome lid subunit RPN8/RPN11